MSLTYPLGSPAVTSTVTVHELPAGIVDATESSDTEPVPAVASTLPPQVVCALGTGATKRPFGNVSVSGAVSATGTPLPLPSEIVSVLVVPAVIVDGVNDLPSV